VVGASGSRPVRIPRSGPGRARAVRVPAAAPRPAPVAPGTPLDRRVNRGGTRRVQRLALLFVIGIAVLFGALALYATSMPGGRSPGSEEAIETFAGIGLVIAAAGALLTLASAPRAVEFGERATVVVGRFGRRHGFPPRGELSVQLIRRYPPDFLSDSEVDVVEVLGGAGKATFYLERGILEPTEA
jgi:hypothetical protein